MKAIDGELLGDWGLGYDAGQKALKQRLESPEMVERLAEALEPFLGGHDSGADAAKAALQVILGDM
jgi:hypothetical protein